MQRIKLLTTVVTQSKSDLFGISESYGQEEFRFRTLHYWYLPYYHINAGSEGREEKVQTNLIATYRGSSFPPTYLIETIATWTETIHCNIFLTV